MRVRRFYDPGALRGSRDQLAEWRASGARRRWPCGQCGVGRDSGCRLDERALSNAENLGAAALEASADPARVRAVRDRVGDRRAVVSSRRRREHLKEKWSSSRSMCGRTARAPIDRRRTRREFAATRAGSARCCAVPSCPSLTLPTARLAADEPATGVWIGRLGTRRGRRRMQRRSRARRRTRSRAGRSRSRSRRCGDRTSPARRVACVCRSAAAIARGHVRYFDLDAEVP